MSCQFPSGDGTAHKLQAESPFFPSRHFKVTWMATHRHNELFCPLSLAHDYTPRASSLSTHLSFWRDFFLLFCIDLDRNLVLTLHLLRWHKRRKILCAARLELLCFFSVLLADSNFSFQISVAKRKKGERECASKIQTLQIKTVLHLLQELDFHSSVMSASLTELLQKRQIKSALWVIKEGIHCHWVPHFEDSVINELL